MLQEGEITRVGATGPIRVDVRPIAATNRTLTREVSDRRFREDLFYRLAVAVIALPPLRERGDDLALLLERLLEQVNRESAGEPGYEPKELAVSARKLLLNHPWPGNVREMLNTPRSDRWRRCARRPPAEAQPRPAAADARGYSTRY